MAANIADPPLPQNPELQAGGGVASTVKRVDHVSATVLSYLKVYAEGRRVLGDEQLRDVNAFGKSTEQPGAKAQGQLELKALLEYMTSEKANAMLPAPALDYDYPISSYFISSSHNSYLQGNQLWGEASSEVYDNILRRGCRCVEIDVYNGPERDEGAEETQETRRGLKAYLNKKLDRFRKDSPDRGRKRGDKTPGQTLSSELRPPAPWRSPSSMRRAEPRVLHGYTLTKEVSFREVCRAIGDAAFATSDLPVIVSLEVHADSEQQGLMVEIMNEEWRDKLVEPLSGDCEALPTLAHLKHKILVKVKAASHSTAPISAAKPEQEAAIDSDSESEDVDTSHQGGSSKKAKKKKNAITEALSAMGIYTQAYHFNALTSPEAKLPAHVFSLSEKKLVDVSEEHGPQLMAHNRQFLMRAYPSGSRLASTNFDPSVYWRMGVQIVALNWQKFDAGVMLNEGQFASTGGYVLKPPSYRHPRKHGSTDSATEPSSASDQTKVDITIELLAAQDLPVPPDASSQQEICPYVKCMLHIEKSKLQAHDHAEKGKKNKEKLKWRSKSGRGTDPDFGGGQAHFRSTKASEELSFVSMSNCQGVANEFYAGDS